MAHVNSLEYITFIFLEATNGIAFLRRNRECSRRWVVGDIGATIDIRTVTILRRYFGQQLPILRPGLGVMIKCCGA
jgi:hypothetical protein